MIIMNKVEQNKKYKAEHATQIAEYNKTYRADNIDAVKETERKYRESHVDEKKEYNQKYREENKTKLTEHFGQKVTCDCGGEYSLCHKARHMKTKKHIDKMAEKANKK